MNKAKLREWIFESYDRIHLFYMIRRLREKKAMKNISDEEYIISEYKRRYNRDIDLADPKTFCEKLQWLKLFYRNDLMPICSDKYRIREYVKMQGLQGLCNDLIGVYDNAKDINFDELPEQFVVKANHGSGWNIICKDKKSLKWSACTKVMNDWLKMNLSVFGREWNYKEIEPKIVIEKYITHEPLYDYKLMCFNGEPLFVQLNNDLDGQHYVDFYDIQTWEHLPITYYHFKRSDRDIERPKLLDVMIEYAKILSKPFPFVRVDFYSFDEVVILGEMTFFPSSGLWPIIPEEYHFDEKFGALLQLPEPNNNLDLLEKLKM